MRIRSLRSRTGALTRDRRGRIERLRVAIEKIGDRRRGLQAAEDELFDLIASNATLLALLDEFWTHGGVTAPDFSTWITKHERRPRPVRVKSHLRLVVD